MTSTWAEGLGSPGPASQAEPYHDPAITQPATMTCGNCMGTGHAGTTGTCASCGGVGSHLVAGSGGPYMDPSGD